MMLKRQRKKGDMFISISKTDSETSSARILLKEFI